MPSLSSGLSPHSFTHSRYSSPSSTLRTMFIACCSSAVHSSRRSNLNGNSTARMILHAMPSASPGSCFQ